MENSYVRKLVEYMLGVYSFFRVEMIFYQKKYIPIVQNDFNLHKAELYINLIDKKDVTFEFDQNNYKFLDVMTMRQLVTKYYPEVDLKNYNLHQRENIRLKLTFEYKDKEYIFYYPFVHKLYLEKDGTGYLPFPLYNEKIMEKIRSDIVLPYYNENKGMKNSLYGVYSIDCKHIQEMKINGKQVDRKMMEYLDKIKTPFNDFGMMYHCPVKISWMLVENGYNIAQCIELFENFNVEIKFMKGYMNEETFEYKEHVFLTKNIDDYFITDYMMERMIKKNEDYGRSIIYIK
jgi:hypothetical protein